MAKLKLWQAILIGCDRRAQGFGSLFRTMSDGSCISCTWGAAIEGTFNKTDPNYGGDLLRECYSFAFNPINKTNCPACSSYRSIACILVHLNDYHYWPREKIALEFVKPIEQELEDADEEINP